MLPDGARPLTEAMTAPPALARSLALAGWVENEEAGRRLQPSLVPGQRLVDRQGRMWRWDGFTRMAPRPSSAAEHLRHRNRLAVLANEIAGVEEADQTAGQNAAASVADRRQAAEAERLARAELRTAEAAAAAARHCRGGDRPPGGNRRGASCRRRRRSGGARDRSCRGPGASRGDGPRSWRRSRNRRSPAEHSTRRAPPRSSAPPGE